MTDTKGIFGTNLELAIQTAGITQGELAALARITPAGISMLIAGQREPVLSTILKICTALHTTPNDLLDFHSGKRVELSRELTRLRMILKDIHRLSGDQDDD